VDQQAVLAAFDEQIRRNPELDATDRTIEHDTIEHDDGVFGVCRSGRGGPG
jgi:hypothetical protein